MRPRPSRRAPTSLLALALLVVACTGDSGETSAGDGTSTASTASTASTTSTTDATSEGSTASASTSSTSAATATSTSTSASTSSTSGESTSTTGTSSSTSGTTGGGDALPCAQDSECIVNNDCCECDAQHVDEPIDACMQECLQSTCDSYGLTDPKAVCHWGVCTFAKVECNPTGVLCKSLPPECPPGFLPSVETTDQGTCWTGSCAPIEACDWAPDCAACAAVPGLTCVAKLQKGAFFVCEPLPPACGDGPATCACASTICDDSPPHTICHDVADGIACECPFC